jgi:hypothetical protein
MRLGRSERPWWWSAVVLGVVAVAIMAFYLDLYHAKALVPPVGWDTSRYLWRTTLARAVGIGHLQGSVPPPITPDQSRPAFPILAGVLLSLTRANPFRLAAVLPTAAAASVGLAAGAFVAALLRRPLWELAAVAVGVGTSAFMVRLMGPETYQDNLFAAAVFMAAALPTIASMRERRALLPAILLFGAGGVVHWAFFAFMGAVLALTVAVLAPASRRAVRLGTRLADTPSGRVGQVLGGGAAVAAVWVFGFLGGATRSPHLSPSEFEKKLEADVPKYRFDLTLPAAALGVLALARTAWGRKPTVFRRTPGREDDAARTDARGVLVFLLAWCGVVATGYVAFVAGLHDLPAHRFLAFALAIPVLGVIGVLWVARSAGRVAARRVDRRLGAMVAVVLVAGVVASSAWLSHSQWLDVRPWIDAAKIADTSNLEAYLRAAHVASDRPIVLIVDDVDSSYTALMGHMARAALPAGRIENLYLYPGGPDEYLARRPTSNATGTPNPLSIRYFASLRPTYAEDPVAVVMTHFAADRYGPWVAAHPDRVVAPGVAVVRGPVLTRPLAAAPTPLPGPAAGVLLASLAVVALGTFALAGVGWSLAMGAGWLRTEHALALSPAVGIAMLVLGWTVADRLGIRVRGAGAVGVTAVVAGAGFAWWWWSSRRRRPASADVGEEP